MAYKVAYKASDAKDLRRLDKSLARRILERLERALSENPRIGVALTGEFKGIFKYRIGDYRVLYTKGPDGVLVLRIAHRREAYR